MNTERTQELAALQGTLMETLRNTVAIHTAGVDSTAASLHIIQEALLKLERTALSIPREEWILQNLFFNSMFDREDSMRAADDETYEWILESNHLESEDSSSGSEDEYLESENGDLSSADEQENDTEPMTPELKYYLEQSQEKRDTARDGFLSWLRGGNGVFHISGKAGSGKSTLMKFLCNHERTRAELEAWAGDNKLVFAKFFFWNSGNKLQMSRQGLYRSLLFETVKQCPELAPIIFPSQWAVAQTAANRSVSTAALHFREPNIREAFLKLTAGGAVSGVRFCFFVDGLDEYTDEYGDSLDHREIAESLLEWASHPDIKICASSRPHLEFMETFSDSHNRRIRLHQLTQKDIFTFCRKAFTRDRNLSHIEDIYPRLLKELCVIADGVFLWAFLAVRLLLIAVARRDSPDQLWQQLRTTPPKLTNLYERMLNSIEPHDRRRTDRFLLLAAHNPFSDLLNVFAFALLDEVDRDADDFPRAFLSCNYSTSELTARLAAAHTQVTTYTAGLLEVVAQPPDEFAYINGPVEEPWQRPFSQRVQFFHRALRD